MLLIDVLLVWFDTFVGTLVFETNNVILSPKYNIFESGVLCCRNFERLFTQLLCSRSVRKPYFRASYRVYKIGCLRVRGISLLVAQLFVIAIENILWVCVGNLTRLLITPYALQKTLGRFSSKKCFFVCYHEKEEGSSY